MKKIIGIAICGAFLALAGTVYGARCYPGVVILDDENYGTAIETTAAIPETYVADEDFASQEAGGEDSTPLSGAQQPSARTETTIEIKDTEMPVLLMGNGDLAVLTRTDGQGWTLEAGEKLTLEFSLDLENCPGADKDGERLVVGYRKDGEVVEQITEKRRNFSYTIQAQEAGSYCFFVKNASAGNVVLLNGTIRNEDGEKEG